jgi:hypothetical protein
MFISLSRHIYLHIYIYMYIYVYKYTLNVVDWVIKNSIHHSDIEVLEQKRLEFYFENLLELVSYGNNYRPCILVVINICVYKYMHIYINIYVYVYTYIEKA